MTYQEWHDEMARWHEEQLRVFMALLDRNITREYDLTVWRGRGARRS